MEPEELKMSNGELLVYALAKMDDALSFLMEIEGEHGFALTHFIYAAVRYGEKHLLENNPALTNAPVETGE
jgi:hypothetical protein